MRGGSWEEMQENRKWRMKTTGDFPVRVDSYIWKLLKNGDDYDDRGKTTNRKTQNQMEREN